jgi:nitrite reductase/ring-hydroxylating ferredoxin subunit
VRKTLCRVDEVPEGGATAREIDSASGGFSVLLTRVDGVVRAFHNECPHAGRRLDWAPGRFLIEGDTLVCAAHGACFALATGEFRGGLARGSGLKSIALTIEDGAVYLG